MAAVAMIVAGMLVARNNAPNELPVPSVPVFFDPDFGAVDQLSSGSRPNIVFVMVDDLDSELIGHMPNLQSLVQAQGASFSNYFVTSALCCPSRSSFMRGQYPHNTTILTNEDGFVKFHKTGLESSTVATWLQAGGYRTALMGKYLNGYLEAPGAGLFEFVPPGWSEWDVAGDGFREYDYTLNHNGTLERYGHRPQDFLTDVLTRRATDFIERSVLASVPFFLELSTFAPHSPYTPPARFSNLFSGAKAPRPLSFNATGSGEPKWLAALPALSTGQIESMDTIYRQRLQAVQGIDAAIATLVDTLRREKVLDNTYIIFTSDNGYHLGQHRLPAGKQTAFDSDIRVPLVIRGPGIHPRQVDAMAMNIDLAPTIAAWAGVSPPGFVDGRALQPVLWNRAPNDWRTTVLIEHTGPPTLPGDPDYQARDNPTSYSALRTSSHLYVSSANGEEELYDRRVDPDELHNVVAQANAAMLRQLRDTLVAMRECKAQTCRRADAS